MSAVLYTKVDGSSPDLPGFCRRLIDISPLPMATVGGIGHILLHVNPAFSRLAGKAPKELIGTSFDRAVPDGNLCLEHIDRVFETGEPASCRAVWSYSMWSDPCKEIGPADVLVVVTDTASVTHTLEQAAEMNKELMISVVRQHELTETAENLNEVLNAEIAERKRTEEALRESESRYRLLFENMLDGFAYGRMLFDDEGSPTDFVYLKTNKAFETLTGLRDVEGRRISEVIPGVRESNSELFETLGRVSRTGVTEEFDLHMPSLEMWFSVSAYSTKKDHFIAVFDNITERKRAEEIIAASERHYRRLFEGTRDGIILLDADSGKIMDVNPCITDMLGYSHKELAGKKMLQAGPVKNNAAAKDTVRKLLKEGIPGAINLSLLAKNGRMVELEVLSGLYEAGGKKIIQCSIRDITDKKNLERARADFVSMLSHDLKTPLTMILLYSELLLETREDLSDDRANMLEAIEQSAEKMKTMVEDFLAVSRLEDGTLQINTAPLYTNSLLEKVAEDFVTAAKQKGLRFETDLPEVPISCIDQMYIERSVSNLLQNAINYTPRGGSVILKVANGDGGDTGSRVPFIEISVTDTGPGIPEAEIGRVFDKYFTAPKAKGIKGTGLGLAIVKAVAEAHGGRVSVESGAEGGSTFHIYLPVVTNCDTTPPNG